MPLSANFFPYYNLIAEIFDQNCPKVKILCITFFPKKIFLWKLSLENWSKPNEKRQKPSKNLLNRWFLHSRLKTETKKITKQKNRIYDLKTRTENCGTETRKNRKPGYLILNRACATYLHVSLLFFDKIIRLVNFG